MTEAVKNLINECTPYVEGTPFDGFYLFSPGEKYTGFWGENGFNQIYIVCVDKKEDKKYIIGTDYQVDCAQYGQFRGHLEPMRVEVSSELNVPYFWTFGSRRFVCNSAHVSDVTIEEYKGEN